MPYTVLDDFLHIFLFAIDKEDIMCYHSAIPHNYYEVEVAFIKSTCG